MRIRDGNQRDVRKAVVDWPKFRQIESPVQRREKRWILTAQQGKRPVVQMTVEHIELVGTAEDLLDDRDAASQYMAAVEDYVTAFNAAEAEAVRRRRNEFSRADQQRIARAQNLLRVASDAAAAPQERQRAYELAHQELDGLIVLPAATQAGIERRISGELER